MGWDSEEDRVGQRDGWVGQRGGWGGAARGMEWDNEGDGMG